MYYMSIYRPPVSRFRALVQVDASPYLSCLRPIYTVLTRWKSMSILTARSYIMADTREGAADMNRNKRAMASDLYTRETISGGC